MRIPIRGRGLRRGSTTSRALALQAAGASRPTNPFATSPVASFSGNSDRLSTPSPTRQSLSRSPSPGAAASAEHLAFFGTFVAVDSLSFHRAALLTLHVPILTAQRAIAIMEERAEAEAAEEAKEAAAAAVEAEKKAVEDRNRLALASGTASGLRSSQIVVEAPFSTVERQKKSPERKTADQEKKALRDLYDQLFHSPGVATAFRETLNLFVVQVFAEIEELYSPDGSNRVYTTTADERKRLLGIVYDLVGKL